MGNNDRRLLSPKLATTSIDSSWPCLLPKVALFRKAGIASID